jgi:hypothetical protein
MRASLPHTLPSSTAAGASAQKLFRPYVLSARRGRSSSSVQARAARYDRRRPPPPDLPSLLFDQRIVYMGMPVSGGRGPARPEMAASRGAPAPRLLRGRRALGRAQRLPPRVGSR